jgi:hypothetical protein
MAVDLVLAPDAHLDLDEAYAWYERRRPGLGEEFLTSVDACMEASANILRCARLFTKAIVAS